MNPNEIRLGVVDFLNAYPLFYGLEDLPGVHLVKGVPSALSDLLYQEKLDAALISSIEYYRNRENYLYYPELCIATQGKTESIRLFLGSGTSLEEVDFLYADYASRSSVVMAKYVLGPLQKRVVPKLNLVHPPYLEKLKKLKKNEALLIIGDEALRLRHVNSMDLGEIYHKLTGRSFVFALWVYLKKIPEKEIHFLLQKAWQKAQNEKEILIKKASEKFGFSLQFTGEYLFKTITYELKKNLLEDMEFFFKEVQAWDLL